MRFLAKETGPVPLSRQLIDAARRYRQVLVMAHNNPDPDAISSGWAVAHLIRSTTNKPVRFIAGGEIVRAENRKMVSLLKPPLELNVPIPFSDDTLLVLVDCDVDTSNHAKIDCRTQPVAVIDHHNKKDVVNTPGLVFQDRRPDIAATASILASYLLEQSIEPPPDLATALVYAIRTETKGGQNHFSPLDHAMLTWLTGQANPSYVAKIEDAPLSVAYFSDLALALQSTIVYGRTAFGILPQSQGPEVVGEVADLLVRCDAIDNVLCGTVYGDHLVFSVRMEGNHIDASVVVRQILEGIGKGGGHSNRAGGIIENVGGNQRTIRELFRMIRNRWRAACGVQHVRGTRLVSRANIMKHL